MRVLLFCFLLIFVWGNHLVAQPTPIQKAAYERGQALVKQNQVEAAALILDSLTHLPDGTLRQDSFGAVVQFTLARNFTTPSTLDAGIPYFKRALRMADSLFTEPHNFRAQIRVGLSEGLISTDRKLAVRLIEEASDMYSIISRPDTAFWVRGLWNLARCYELEENIEPAENAIQLAINLSENNPSVPISTKFLVYYEAGMLDATFRNGTLAGLENARTGLAYAKRQPDPMYVFASYELIANLHLRRKEFSQQRRLMEQSIGFLKKQTGLEYLLGDVHVALSNSYRLEGDIAAALANADKAVNIQRAYDPGYLFYGLSTRAKVHAAAQRYDLALADINESLVEAAGGAVEEIEGVPYFIKDSIRNVNQATTAYSIRSDLFTAMNRPELALKDIKAIIAFREKARQSVNLSESKLYLSETLSEFYSKAIDLHYELHDQGEEHLWEALLLSDKAKGFSLLASLNEQRAEENERLPLLQTEIADLEQKSASSGTDANRLAAARLELERLMRKSRLDLPPVKEYTRDDLEQQLKALDADVLAYHFGLDNSYFFHIPRAGQISMRRLEEPGSLTQTIKDWRGVIKKGAYRIKSLRSATEQQALDADFLRLGKELRQALLPPEFGNELLIVPDGAVNYLPFGALPLEEMSLPLDYTNVAYLQQNRRLRYTYSLRYLHEVKQLPVITPDHELIAFAPTFGGNASATEVSRSVVEDGKRSFPTLAPLIYNVDEVKKIVAGVQGALAFLGPAATREKFNEISGQGKIIHLSSHGMVDVVNPKGSFIAFSQSADEMDPSEFLFFNELPALDLNAELVVLSACETSLGNVVPGETVLSMAMAFTAAGARSTLTSLWQVDDAATQELMVDFYHHLKAGKSRAEALATAQQKLRENETYTHPYFWSGMVLHGETGEIELSGHRLRWWLWLAGMGFVITGVFLWKRNVNHKK